jgi:hypothetical protein
MDRLAERSDHPGEPGTIVTGSESSERDHPEPLSRLWADACAREDGFDRIEQLLDRLGRRVDADDYEAGALF